MASLCSRPSLLAAMALTLYLMTVSSAAPTPAECCVAGGDGSATMSGDIILDLHTSSPGAHQYPAHLVVDAVNMVTGIIIGADSAGTAVAGWLINQNATAQWITAWNHNDGGAIAPTCVRDVVPLSSDPSRLYVPGFRACPGAASNTLFPVYVGSFSLGSVQVNSWSVHSDVAGHGTSSSRVACASQAVRRWFLTQPLQT